MAAAIAAMVTATAAVAAMATAMVVMATATAAVAVAAMATAMAWMVTATAAVSAMATAMAPVTTINSKELATAAVEESDDGRDGRQLCSVYFVMGSTKRILCGIVLFKLNTFLVMFLHVPSIDSTCFPRT
jgi:hypothetical protein